jgi:hypothetical protein
MRKLYHSEQGTSSKFGHKYFALALTATPKDRYNQSTCSLAGLCDNSADYGAVSRADSIAVPLKTRENKIN